MARLEVAASQAGRHWNMFGYTLDILLLLLKDIKPRTNSRMCVAMREKY
jgi:hypothetical protein